MDDTVVDFLQKAADIHAAHKPASGPHPLGAPRHLLFAAWIEGCVQRYENNKVLKQEALMALKSLDILEHFKKLFVAINSKAASVESLRQLVNYAAYRETREGKGLFRVNIPMKRILDTRLQEYGLTGVHNSDWYDLLKFSCIEEFQYGPAPPGQMERNFTGKRQ